MSFSKRLFDAGYELKFIPRAIVMHDDERYSQKGYGVIRTAASRKRTAIVHHHENGKTLPTYSFVDIICASSE